MKQKARKLRGYSPVRAKAGEGEGFKVGVEKGFGPRHGNNAKEGQDLTKVNTDTVPALLSPREAVLTRNAAELMGRGNIEKLNAEGNQLARKGVDLAQEGDDDVPFPMRLPPEGADAARADEQAARDAMLEQLDEAMRSRGVPPLRALLNRTQYNPRKALPSLQELNLTAQKGDNDVKEKAKKYQGGSPYVAGYQKLKGGPNPVGEGPGSGAFNMGGGGMPPVLEGKGPLGGGYVPGKKPVVQGDPAGGPPGYKPVQQPLMGIQPVGNGMQPQPAVMPLGSGAKPGGGYWPAGLDTSVGPKAMPPQGGGGMPSWGGVYGGAGGGYPGGGAGMPGSYGPPGHGMGFEPGMPPGRRGGGRRHGFGGGALPFQGGAAEVPAGPIGSPNPQQAYGPPITLSAPDLSKLLQQAGQQQGLNAGQIAGLAKAFQGFSSIGADPNAGGNFGPTTDVSGGYYGLSGSPGGGYQGGISDIGYPPFVAPGAEYHADKGGWLGPYDPAYTFNSYARGISSVPFR